MRDEHATGSAVPPEGLEGFTTFTDPNGTAWWYRRHEGWDVFTRTTDAKANLGVFPMQLGQQQQQVAANYGVVLNEENTPNPGEFTLDSNSDELERLMLGRPDLTPSNGPELVEHVEQPGPIVPPWNRPLPDPKFAVDFSGLVWPAAILGASILIAVLIRTFVKR